MVFLSLYKRLLKQVKNYAILETGLTILVILDIAIYNLEKANGSTMFQTPWDGAWWGIITAATIGYGDKFPQTFWGQFLALFFIFISLGIFAQVAGIIVDFIYITNNKKMSGTYSYNSKNHTIVYGDDSINTESVLKQIVNEHKEDNFILMTNTDSCPSFVTTLQKIAPNLHWVKGTPEQAEALKNSNTPESKAFILLSEETLNADKITLAYVMSIQEQSPSTTIIADIKDNAYKARMIKAGADSVINSHEISCNLLARSLTDKVNPLIEELLDNGKGFEIYLCSLKDSWFNSSKEVTFLDVKNAYLDQEIQIVSVLRETGEVKFNNNLPLNKNDKVYIFSDKRMLEV